MAIRSRRAFTLIEVGALSALLAMGGAGAALLQGEPDKDPLTRSRAAARQIKCATNLRQIETAMVIWAQANREMFPIPSDLDKNNTTIALAKDADARAKDTTGNILSMMIWNGMITPETCVSPAEANPSIKVDEGYQVTNPEGAANKAEALWDPRFAGTPDDAGARTKGVGNTSYAHAVPMGARKPRWSNTFSATEATWANRGPGYVGTAWSAGGWKLNPKGATPPGEESVTLKIHGKADAWEGNVAYNDAHVNFETRPDPVEITYRRTPAEGEGATNLVVADNLFVNESDDASRKGEKAQADLLSGINNWLVMVSGVEVKEGKVEMKMFKD